MIKTEKLTRTFPLEGGESITVLKGIDIEIPKQSLAILKGRSGSGKTTLVNILSALDLPSTGKVYFDGKDMCAMTEAEREALRRYEMGYIFQAVALVPVMNVYENVELSLRLAGYTGNRKERVEECLKKVGMLKRIDHMPSELSGGEQQRVAIARALAHNPKVLFADEPTGAVDQKTSIMIQDMFRKLNKELGLTIVIVTHDISLAKKVDRVVMIRDGKISSERLMKQDYLERIKGLNSIEHASEILEGAHEEFAILDRAGRVQLTKDILEQAGIEGTRGKVEVVDGKVIISQ